MNVRQPLGRSQVALDLALSRIDTELHELFVNWLPSVHGSWYRRETFRSYRGRDGVWRWGSGRRLNRRERRLYLQRLKERP